MRRNLTRYYGSGDLHFITCSCYARRPLLGTARRRDLFLHVLEQVRRRYQFVVVGYVVMPEHIHLLLSEPQVKTLSTVMQEDRLRAPRAGAAAAAQSGAVGTVRRPAAAHLAETVLRFQCMSAHKRVEKLRYIHRNPVTRGLVASPELWRWSSFRAYALGESGLVRVNDWTVLKLKIRPPAA